MRQMISVPICNDCGKPHYGRRNVDDRCVCDTSGNFHYSEIEEEPVEQPSEPPKVKDNGQKKIS